MARISRDRNCAAALLFTRSSGRLCYCAGVVVDGWVVDGCVDGVVVDGSVVDGVVDGVVVDGAVVVGSVVDGVVVDGVVVDGCVVVDGAVDGSVVVAGGVAVSVAVSFVPGIRNIAAKMMITPATTRPITVFRLMQTPPKCGFHLETWSAAWGFQCEEANARQA